MATLTYGSIPFVSMGRDLASANPICCVLIYEDHDHSPRSLTNRETATPIDHNDKLFLLQPGEIVVNTRASNAEEC